MPPDDGGARAFVRDVRLTTFAADRLWPLLRPLAGRSLPRRCRRCILSQRHGPLDGDGLCAACAAWTPPPAAAPRPLVVEGPTPVDALFAAHAGRAAGAYDCLLLISGGKDSAYLLHRLRTRHPRLRLLTALVDNRLMSPIALGNADALVRRAGVDHARLHPDPALASAALRWALCNLDRQRGYSIVDSMDGQITFDTAMNRAAAWGIPLVAAGLSRHQIEDGFGAIGCEFPYGERQWIAAEGVRREQVVPDAGDGFWHLPGRWPAERRPRFLIPFMDWDPSEDHILATVAREGLVDPARSSPALTNNRLIPIIILAEYARRGWCCFEVEFARMVREGRSQRARWLNLFQLLEYAAASGRFPGTIDRTLAQLGLDRRELGLPA